MKTLKYCLNSKMEIEQWLLDSAKRSNGSLSSTAASTPLSPSSPSLPDFGETPGFHREMDLGGEEAESNHRLLVLYHPNFLSWENFLSLLFVP